MGVNKTDNLQTELALRCIDELPSPRGIPIFGNVHQIKSPRIHQMVEAWCRELGPIFTLKVGAGRILVVGDHEEVANVLRDRPDGFRRPSRLEEIWDEMGLPSGVFSANGEVWRRQRRMVMASFDPGHVKRYFPSLQRLSARLASRWRKAAKASTAIDVRTDITRFTVDAIAGLAFGAEVNTLESGSNTIHQHLDMIFPALFKRINSIVPTWRMVRMPSDYRLERSLNLVIQAVTGFVKDARARMDATPSQRDSPNNLLEAMIAAADREDSGIDDSQVAGNVLTMLLAGEETTANTLTWLLYLLWSNPETLSLATAEVRQVMGDSDIPTLEHIEQLDYIEACLHETMRLKPVTPFMMLETLRDVRIADVQVPRGMLVICMFRHHSVSDSHVPNAASFEPKRWLTDADPSMTASSVKRISMPFGAGPRICPGRYLAMMEMKLTIAVLLCGFEIEHVGTPNGKEPEEQLVFNMAPVGLSMRLRERASQR